MGGRYERRERPWCFRDIDDRLNKIENLLKVNNPFSRPVILYERTESIVLEAIDIVKKFIILAQEPYSKNTVNLIVFDGPSGVYNLDYKIDDSNKRKLTWDGLGFEELLGENDKIIVSYFIT